MSDPSMTGDLVERLREHLQLRFMTASKINGETYQMVTPWLLDIAASVITKQADEIEAMNAKLAGIETCACSYDAPGEVCAHHSPALLASQSSHAAARENFLTMQGAAATLLTRAETAEARIAVLEAALKFYAEPTNYKGEFIPGGYNGTGGFQLAHFVNLVRKDGGQIARNALVKK